MSDTKTAGLSAEREAEIRRVLYSRESAWRDDVADVLAELDRLRSELAQREFAKHHAALLALAEKWSNRTRQYYAVGGNPGSDWAREECARELRTLLAAKGGSE